MWSYLPNDIIDIIIDIKIKKINKMCTKIQSIWRCYKTRVLVGRYKLLRYIKEFREYNTSIYSFLIKSRL